MGGHIWIESEGLGKGTTVTFLVRLGDCNSLNHPAIRVTTHQGSGELITHRHSSSEDYKATASFPRYVTK